MKVYIASRPTLQKNVKINSSGRRKIIDVRNSDVHKEEKIIREGIN